VIGLGNKNDKRGRHDFILSDFLNGGHKGSAHPTGKINFFVGCAGIVCAPIMWWALGDNIQNNQAGDRFGE
jgi:hypothetical protein